MNVTKKIIIIILLFPLCLYGMGEKKSGSLIQQGRDKFRTISSLTLKPLLHKNTPTTPTPTRKKRSLSTSSTPVFELPSEEEYEENHALEFSSIKTSIPVTRLEANNIRDIISALTTLLGVKEKSIIHNVPSNLPITSTDDLTKNIIKYILHYTIYAVFIEHGTVTIPLIENIFNENWITEHLPEKSSQKTEDVYTLAYELASPIAQQYLLDVLNNKDTKKELAALSHELQPISKNPTKHRTKKRGNT